MNVRSQKQPSKDENFMSESDDSSSQTTDNPCYGLTLSSDKHLIRKLAIRRVAESTESSTRLAAEQIRICTIDAKEFPDQKSNENKSVCEPKFHKTISANENGVSNCAPRVQPPAVRNNRICKRCHKKQSFDSRTLEDVVNMFDRHLNVALSRQQKNNVRQEREDEFVHLPLPKYQTLLKDVQVSKRIPMDVPKKATKDDVLSASAFRNVYSANETERLLSTASRETPANVPMVVMQCTRLRPNSSSTELSIQESALAMGTLVSALFRESEWFYVRTPHGKEGFVHQMCCTSMGSVIQNKFKTGRHRARSRKSETETKSFDVSADRFDSAKNSKKILYNVLADVNPACFNTVDEKANERDSKTGKKLAVIFDYVSTTPRTLTVKKGDVLTKIRSDPSNADWLLVQLKSGKSGYVPKAVTAPIGIYY